MVALVFLYRRNSTVATLLGRYRDEEVLGDLYGSCMNITSLLFDLGYTVAGSSFRIAAGD